MKNMSSNSSWIGGNLVRGHLPKSRQHVGGRTFSATCIVLALVATFAMAAPSADAQSYPAKPITIIVPFAPGSSADQMARGIGRALTDGLPNNPAVVIDNRPGANGFIAAQMAAKAAPDGYTLFYTTNTTQSANPYLFKKLPYDPVADFAPISGIATGAMVLTVPISSPVNTVGDFIALAKKGQLSFGAGNSSSRIAGEMFKQMTGVNLLFVPYKSNPPAVVDLMGGQIDAMFADTASTLPQIQAGKLRAVAFTGATRTPFLPNLPTISESGVPGYSLYYWGAMYAPRGTPPQLIKLLNTQIVKGIHTSAFKTLLAAAGLSAYSTTPEELAEFQQTESLKWARVIKNAGIDPE